MNNPDDKINPHAHVQISHIKVHVLISGWYPVKVIKTHPLRNFFHITITFTFCELLFHRSVGALIKSDHLEPRIPTRTPPITGSCNSSNNATLDPIQVTWPRSRSDSRKNSRERSRIRKSQRGWWYNCAWSFLACLHACMNLGLGSDPQFCLLRSEWSCFGCRRRRRRRKSKREVAMGALCCCFSSDDDYLPHQHGAALWRHCACLRNCLPWFFTVRPFPLFLKV